MLFYWILWELWCFGWWCGKVWCVLLLYCVVDDWKSDLCDVCIFGFVWGVLLGVVCDVCWMGEWVIGWWIGIGGGWF